MNRRQFLWSLTATLGNIQSCGRIMPPLPAGEILGASSTLGHRLRVMDFPEPTETQKIPVLIVGGGIAGLSAGWSSNKRRPTGAPPGVWRS